MILRNLKLVALLAASLLGLLPAQSMAVNLDTTWSETCPVTGVGSEQFCGSVRFQWTVTGETVQNPTFFVSGNTGQFRVDTGTCFPGQTNPLNSRCSLAFIYYKPVNGGTHTITVGATTAYGTDTIVISGSASFGYAWRTGEWTPANSCSEAVAQTRSVACFRSDNQPAADTDCPSPKPDATRTVQDLSGCTYSWTLGAAGACTGGSGAWTTTDWLPASGCGLTPQARTVSCLIDVNSGTSTRDASCMRSDGTAVSSEHCAGPAPAATQACTPGATAVCGEEPAASQSVTLTDGCTGGGTTGGSGGAGATPKELCVPHPTEGKYCLYLRLQ